jgi:DNA-binding beta-propeller fold protein YncE
VDRRRHTVYVANENDATLSVLDASTCNAHATAGCDRGPTLRVGWDPQTGYVDAAHGTVYVVNRVGRSVSVVGSATCNAARTDGCRRQVSTAPAGAFSADLAVDRSTHTVYVSNAGGSVSLIDGASCNARDRTGCTRTPPAVSVPEPDDLVVDPAHHTLYVASFLEHGTVTMIDTATCRTGVTRGCAGPHHTFPVGAFPDGLALNPRTHTLYAADTTGTLTVIDTDACNARHRAGCDAHAPTVAVPKGAFRMAVDRATDTVYVGQFGVSDSNGTRVAVVDGSTCNAIRHTGCGKAHATIILPVGITGLLVDEATRTLYVAHHDPASSTGIVSVIDITHCNGTTAAGCDAAPTDVLAPYAPVGLAIDPRTHRLYVTGAFDSAVWIFDVGRCTGSDHRSCGARPQLVEVGSTPHAAELDPATGTLYAPNVGDGDVSLVPLIAR